MNAWMVEQGWAVAYRKYSRDYVSQEATAKAARRGLWRGEFVQPSRWRRGERLEAAGASRVGDCRIKGNISRKGTRIYHVPGGASYAKTRIDTAKGERWFCSESEAARRGGGGRSGECLAASSPSSPAFRGGFPAGNLATGPVQSFPPRGVQMP